MKDKLIDMNVLFTAIICLPMIIIGAFFLFAAYALGSLLMWPSGERPFKNSFNDFLSNILL